MHPLSPGGLLDVWLQLSLGEILRQERPRHFAQLHAPPAFVALDALPEPPLAALAFARAARSSPSLAATLFGRALVRELSREPARLPGPAVLALATLGPAGASLSFAPADLEALESIRAAAGAFAVPESRLELGSASLDASDVLALLAAPSGLGEGAAARDEAFATFAGLAAQGRRALLPLAVQPPHPTRAELRERVRSLAARLPAAAIWCGVLDSEAPATDPRSVPPGCALLAAHLSPQSQATCRELGIRLAHALSTDPASEAHLGTLSYAEA